MKNRTNTKKLLALGMATIFALTTAGCGTQDNSGATGSAADQTVGSQSAESSGNYTKIVYSYWTMDRIPDEDARVSVENAINEITREKIGVEVELMPLAASEQAQKLSLAMASGEQIDIFNTVGELNTYISNNQVYDITDLISDHAQGAVDQVSEEFLKTTSKDGRIYGIPADKGIALAPNLYYRKDIADELGLDFSEVTCIEDLTPIYEKVAAAYPNMSALAGGAGGLELIHTFKDFDVDYLTDSWAKPMGAVLIGDDMTVKNLYASDQFKEKVELMRDWYEKGYVMKDSATTTASPQETVAAGKAFSFIGNQAGNYGVQEASSMCGYDMGYVRLAQPYLDTTAVNTVTWCISSQCKNPDKALDFLNLTYTDPDVVNLIVFGLEGRDYVKVSDREMVFPDGLDANTVPYTAQFSCGVVGSQFKQLVHQGTPADNNDLMYRENHESKTSPAFGFTFDNSSVKTEYTAVTNVINQYLPGLVWGSIDPETELPKFQAALKDAGLDAIIAEKQKQLDAWAAQQ